MTTIVLNGKDYRLDEPTSIADLLNVLKLSAPGLAIALNDEIIPRENHRARRVQEGDRVEIIKAIGGG